jgi:hypothetical protein
LQDNFEYLILTHSSLSGPAASFASVYNIEIEESLRLTTHIIYADSVAVNYPDVDPEYAIWEQISTYINDIEGFKYLFILGDEILVPPIYDNYQIPSDDFYSSFDLSNPLPRVASGRIPVNSSIMAEGIVQKLRSYLLTPTEGNWKSEIVLIADDAYKPSGDPLLEVTHVLSSNDLFQELNGLLQIDCIYGTDYEPYYGSGIPTLPEMTEDIIDKINSGLAWLNYIGHGNETTMGDELILDMERDLSLISSIEGKLPVWVVGSCDLGHYDNADCFAENLMQKPDGAIAVISTTRLILSQSVNAFMTRLYSQLTDYLLGINESRLGDIIKDSKTGQTDYVFQLFGDPAMPIILPRSNEIITNYPDSLEILSQSHVSIENQNSDYSFIKVRGPDKLIHKQITDILTIDYTLPGDLIFASNIDTQIDFYTSLDYPFCNNCPATITVFQDNSTHPFQSISDQVSDIQPTLPDEIYDFDEPEIQLISEGNIVNDWDIFYQPISFEILLTDSTGINLMDMPGHCISVGVDDNMPDNITSEFEYFSENSYSGIVGFTVSGLTTGIHTLSLEAWDNANNRGTASFQICIENCEEIPMIIDDAWDSITSMITANSIVGFDDGTILVATDGGLFKYSSQDGGIEMISPGSQLLASNLKVVKKDTGNRLWIGSDSEMNILQIYDVQMGLLESISDMGITGLSDLALDQSRAFGIVELNDNSAVAEFRIGENSFPYLQDVYSNFPIEVNSISHISMMEDSVYVTTPTGILKGNFVNGLLNASNSWEIMNEDDIPIVFIPGESDILIAGNSLFLESDGEFVELFDGFDNVVDAGYESDGNLFILMTDDHIYCFDQNFELLSGFPIAAPVNSHFTSFYVIDDTIYAGLFKQGMMIINVVTHEYSYVSPNTIFSNEIDAISVDQNSGIIAAVNKEGMMLVVEGYFSNYISSYHTEPFQLNDDNVNNFSGYEIPYKPGSNLPWSIIQSATGKYLFSNSGIQPNQPGFAGGIIEFDPVNLQLTVYDTTSGILDGLNGIYNQFWSNRYLTIHQITKDTQDNIWVVNPYSEVYNHIAAIQHTDGNNWGHVTATDNNSYLPQEVAFDSFGRAWFALKNDIPMNDNLEEYASGEIRILDFGLTVDIEDDDIWVPISNLEILPSKSIWSIGFDNNDLLWILTSDGIQAYSYEDIDGYITLDPIFDNPLLGHIPLYKADHIRIDNHDNKWITTKNSGLFLILSDNSFFPDEEGFNTDNSPILSNTVFDIDFNYEESLAVIGTLNGISLYDMSNLPSTETILVGDINNDGQIDVTDAVLLIFYILGLDIPEPINTYVADLNQDEIIDIADVVQLIGLILDLPQQNVKYLKNVEYRSIGKEIIIEADGGFSVIHLLFSNPIIDDIIQIEGNWEIFRSKYELIIVNMTEHTHKRITIQLNNNNSILSGRMCSINAVCLDIIEIPTELSIEFAYPNPFNPIVNIGILVPENGYYDLTVFDLTGRLTQNIFSGELKAGKYQYKWNARDKGSGIYFVRFSNNENHFIKKIALLK